MCFGVFLNRAFFGSLLCCCSTETGVGVGSSTLGGGASPVVSGADCFVASTLGGGARFYGS